MERARHKDAPAILRHLVIRASAGTGKTFQLSLRYIGLLHQGVAPEHILASTFTRKAAGEILERIIVWLAEAALQDHECRRLGEFLGSSNLQRADCLSMLQAMLRRLHRLRIGTLDKLFAQLARSFSLEIGLPPGWRIVTEAEDEALRQAAIDQLVQREQTGELLSLTHLLTKGEATRGVHELIQGTVAMLHGLYQETDADAWQALPRFKPLAKRELAQVIAELEQLSLPGTQLVKARNTDCERAEREAWDDFLGGGLAAKVLGGEPTFYKKPIPAEAMALYQRLIEQARAELVGRVVRQTEGSYSLLHRFDEFRRTLLQEHGGLRFDDITRALDRAMRGLPTDAVEPSVTFLAGVPDAATSANLLASPHSLAHRLDGQVTHLLLDEFQDTSPMQWRALQGLVESVIGERSDTTFFCVGDVKQAIYGWRGGVAEIFDDIERQLPSLERRQLNTSFRSSRAVIDCVNQVFQGAQRHPDLVRAAEGVAAWCAGFEPHTTAHDQWAGYACLRTAGMAAQGSTAEAAVLDAAAELIDDLHRQAPTRDIGVLVRKNATVASLIHRLRRRHLPASEEGGNPLTDSAAVQLILSLLRLSDHPGDTVVRFHVAESPLGAWLGLGSPADGPTAARLAEEVRRNLQTGGYGPTIQQWSASLRPHVGRRDLTRLEQLVERAFAYQPRATLRADDFVRSIELERVAEPSRAPIRVMTIHQSKGLEFDAVVLPELDENLFSQTPAFVIERPQPTAPVSCVCRYANADVQQLLPPRFQQMFSRAVRSGVVEAMCLLYVALTRAVHGLHIVIQPVPVKPERFKQTMAGLVRAALARDVPAEPHMVLFECGDSGWWRSLDGSDAAPAMAEPTVVASPSGPGPARIQLAPTVERRRGLERISPSGLEGGTHVRLRRQLDRGSEAAMLRGTILHACLAAVQWLDDGIPTATKLQEIVAETLRNHRQPPDKEPWVLDFQRLLQQPWLREQLQRSAYSHWPTAGLAASVTKAGQPPPDRLEVDTEQPFAVRDGAGLLSGSIDRLVRLYQRRQIVAADIIDFKTDTLRIGDDSALQERVQYYEPQLAAYRRAVARLTGLPPEAIAARLFFLSVGQIIVVPSR